MRIVETNIFPIENLDELECSYWIYRIKGLPRESEDYPKNIQLLVDKVSRETSSPCIAIAYDGYTAIAQQTGFPELPRSVNLVGTVVLLEKIETPEQITFESLDSRTGPLASRFLTFSLQGPLMQNDSLWRPSAGRPFFQKMPDQSVTKLSSNIDLLRGFTFQVVNDHEGGLGICIDTKAMYLSRSPLPAKISHDEFKRYKGSKCVYEYGNSWYEIKLEALNDLDVSTCMLPNSKSLYQDVHDRSGNRKSSLLRSLPRDCSVLTYYNRSMSQRNVPSRLCRQVFRTNHPSVRRLHRHTIMAPHTRKQSIRFVLDNYLNPAIFSNRKLGISRSPIRTNNLPFQAPDLLFGHEKVLSVRRTPGAAHADLSSFPFKKMEMFRASDGGPYAPKAFERQYIVMPDSINGSYGKYFINDLISEIRTILPQNVGSTFEPVVIGYDRASASSAYGLGREIIASVSKNRTGSGFALVMIPRLLTSNSGTEDELANTVMNELRKLDIYASIVHTDMCDSSYISSELDDGSVTWQIDENMRSKYRGYIRNVVLNKVLINNSIWPFVLATPLNADATIGIDVKNNTAGFVLVHKSGADLRFAMQESMRKEELSKNQIIDCITSLFEEENLISSRNVSKIVVHRQGRLFHGEAQGLRDSFSALADEGIIAKDYEYAFADVRTTSHLPLRFFSVQQRENNQRDWIENPLIGTWHNLTEDTAFICTTGYPYEFSGTVKPIYVKKVEGAISMPLILEDLFYLSNLTWTKVDDCSRLPITIKMNDIRLRQVAGEYDLDAYRFGEE